ncbi:MAG: hypothetical protein ACOCP4_00075 [Candidatus Woesearchaeota archaeon]
MPQPSIKQILNYAEKHAKDSRITKMEIHLSRVESNDIEKTISKKIEEIREIGYKKVISNYLKKAERKSKLGDYSGFDHYSNRIKMYSKKIGISYPDKLYRLEEKMYPRMLKKNKKKLKGYIKSGNLEFLVMSLIKIRKASDSLGKDIDDLIYDSQKHFNVEELVSLYHDNAMIRAKVGNVHEVNLIFKNTKKYYPNLNHSFLEEREIIKEIAHNNSKINYVK